MLDDRYNIGNNSYSALMKEKTMHYNNLVRRAEVVNRDNGGKATKEEGDLYNEAINVCAEIINMNISQRAVYTKWSLLKKNCESELRRIIKELAPPKPAAPANSANAPEQKSANKGVAPASKPGDVNKAASGFTTQNAVKEVPAETIEKWFKAKPSHNCDDVAGMDEIKDLLRKKAGSLGWERLDSTLNISPVQSFFFYGPPGSGKTYLIEAFASEMMEKGFKYIRLLGGDIHASLVGVAEKTVEIAFKEAIDNEPCIIFIDEVENVCVSRSGRNVEGHEKRLTVAFLEAYNLLKESKKRVIFMGATNYPSQVDEAMLDRINMVRIPLPDVGSRTNYFKRKFSLIMPEEGFTFEDMAELTDNYSFRDLDRQVDTVLERIRAEAIDAYRVFTPEGELDQVQTDMEAADAIARGDVVLTRELFEQVRFEFPPSNKAAIRAELEAFEASVRANLG